MLTAAWLSLNLNTPLEAAAPSDASYETSMLAGVGGAGGETVGGPAASLTLLHHLYFLQLGAELYGAALFSSVAGAGALAGVHFGSDFSVRVMMAGGTHAYRGVGAGILSDDPGVSGAMPYVGGRLLVGYSFGKQVRLFVGLSGMVDEDLERQHKSVTYVQEGWLFGGTSEVTSEHTVGQTTWAGLGVAGWEFDVAPY